MNNRRDDFLSHVERLARRQGLSEEIRRALQDELKCHLEASVQARLETGESLEEAEVNAIRAFGPVTKIIASLGEVHVPRPKRISRPFLLSALALLGSYSFAFGFPSASVGMAIFAAVLAALLWFVVASFRVRRLQLLAILVAAVPCWLIIAVLNSTHSTTFGINSFRTSELPHLASTLNESARTITAYADAYENAFRRFKEEGGNMGLRGFNTRTGVVILRKLPDHEAAVRSWQFVEEDLREMRRGALDAQRQADAALAAYDRPWFANIPGNLLPAGGAALMLVVAAFLIHAPIVFGRWFVVELGKAVRASRRSHLSPVLERTEESGGVGVVEFAAHGHTVSQASNPDSDGFEQLREI